MHKSKFRILFLSALISSGCATGQKETQFSDLETDRRKLFIALYPELSQDERERFLADPTLSEEEEKKFGNIIKNPSSGRIRSLEIENGKVGRDKIPLRAILVYEDGRRADASLDVQWDVAPNLAQIDHSMLKFDCVHSDVTVAANFFNEAAGKHTFQFRKPIRSLQLSVDESSQSIQKTDVLTFKLKAFCTDGTSADVTCEAQWASPDPSVEVSGCGVLRVKSAQRSQVQVNASYGDKNVSKVVALKR